MVQFENRDFKTTNELVYAVKEKANVMMDPHYKPEQTQSVLSYPTKAYDEKRQKEMPTLYSTTKGSERKTKPYGESTKLFDKAFMKTGLRK